MKQWIFCLYLVILCLLVQGHANEIHWEQTAPGGFSIHVELPKTEISLLDTLSVTVTATFPADYHLNWSALKSHLLFDTGFSDTAFQLISQTLSQVTTNSQGIATQKSVFVLTPLVAGKQALTFLNIQFEAQDPQKHPQVEIISAIFEVDITLPPSTAAQTPMSAPLLTFKDEFPVDADSSNRRALEQQTSATLNVQVFKEREIPWIGLLALAAAFALLLTAKKTTTPPPTKTPASNRQQALENLQRAHELLQQKSYDAYYTALTQIIRHYIEATYHVAADARTTEEFLHEMAIHPIFSNETQEALQAFLQNADRVKYGHLPTTEKDAEEAFHLAIELVES